jgi:hypothetical protein
MAEASNVPVRVYLEDGTVLEAKSVAPRGPSDLKITLLDGKVKFVGTHKVKTILDADGIDETARVIDERRPMP